MIFEPCGADRLTFFRETQSIPHKSQNGRRCRSCPQRGLWSRENRFEQVLQHLHQGFSAYLGKNVFEKICQEWLAIQADKKELTFVPERIGSYWDKQVQIDVMAVNHHDQIILAGECKWTNKEMTAEDITSLEQRIKWVQRQYDYTIQLIFFSRSGFSASAKDLAHKKHYRLVGLADLFF